MSYRLTPCPDDILRTRLTTLGVEEHQLSVEGGQIEQSNREWVIYDVGGSRTQRGEQSRSTFISVLYTNSIPTAAWVPYFDDGERPVEPNMHNFITPISSDCHHIHRAFVRI